MGSVDRLREILWSGASAPRRELTYEPLDANGESVTPARGWLDLPGVRGVDTPFGPVCVVERVTDGTMHHGSTRVDECGRFDPVAIDTLRGRPLGLEAIATPRAVFVDLETTGLSGGAGTVAFLVGLGRFDDDGSFRTQQFFLPGFAGERAMLHAVGEATADAELVVTYNGGSFDLPVMETRWLFHRLAPALGERPHLDMLPPARRLWRQTLDGEERSCRLVALEEAKLGVVRVGDVPGLEIPARYFEFVRSGDALPLVPVLEHNRFDLLSLAVLLGRAQRLVREGALAASDAREGVALGRVFERAGRWDEAEAAYRVALEHPVSGLVAREDGWLSLARLLRRRRRFADAAAAWRQVLSHGDRRSAAGREAFEALAVHHEHRERDLVLARALAVRALARERDRRKREAIEHRLSRLDRKLERLRAELGDIDACTSALPWDAADDQDSDRRAAR